MPDQPALPAGAAAPPDAQHPWPWLEPFDESSQAFFNGRDDDVRALQRCVAAAPVSLLYGKSGLGKTSLLRAGLFPQLDKVWLLPVLLRRIERAEEPGALSAQLLQRLDEAAARHGLHWQGPAPAHPAASPVAALWERLHDRELALQDAAGHRFTPLFVLDQFEEVFTLMAAGAGRTALLVELGNLLENRVPAEVDARLDAHDTLLDRIDVDRQGGRFLLSLREDFLPEIDALAARMPRLQANRCRLRAMSRPQALQAVQRTGGALVTADAAQQIVDFLARPAAGAHPAEVLRDDRPVEPALLSLLCASLNAERLARQPPAATLDVQNLEGRGARVIEQFYDRAFDALPPERRAALAGWVERELITASGTRRPFPRRDIDASLRADVERLVGQRLLRFHSGEAGEQVELVHDRLAAVAQARALLRRQAAEAQLQAERERDLAARRLLEEEKRSIELERRREAERAEWARERAERAAQQTRRRWTVLSAGLLLVALAASAGVFALMQAQRSTEAQAALAERVREDQAREADALQRATRWQLAEAQAERDRHLAVLKEAARVLREGGAGADAQALRLLQQASGEVEAVTRQAQADANRCPAGRRLYPQVGERDDIALVDKLAPGLRRAGWLVLRTELVEARKMPQRTELRYFRSAEADLAADAAAVLQRAGLPPLKPLYVTGFEQSTTLRACHFELWLVPRAP